MLLLSFGCTRKESGSALDNASGSSRAQQTSGALGVKIIPEVPTAASDLQAVFSGQGQVSYQWKKNGRPFDGVQTENLAKENFVKGDTIAVTVTAGGSEGTVKVRIANSLPRVVSVEAAKNGQDIVMKPVAFDADGDEVQFRYQWIVNGNDLFDDSPVFPRAKIMKGDDVLLRIIPYDLEGEGPAYVSQNPVYPNMPPQITSSPPTDFQGETYEYQVTAEDPDGDRIGYSLAAAPEGMTIDKNSGLITWILNEKSAGAHDIQIVAQDPDGMKSLQKYTLTIKMPTGEGK